MQTKRFYIRKLNRTDANTNYVSWFKDKSVKQFIQGSTQNITISFLKKYIATQNKNKNTLFFGIFSKKDKHVGNIKFNEINKKHNKVFMGILIGDKNYRGIGLTKEVVDFFSEYFYINYNISNILLGVDKKNQDAIKAYKKSDFQVVKSYTNKNSLIMNRGYFFEKKIIIGTAQFLDNYGINRVKSKLSDVTKKSILTNSLSNKFIYFDTSNAYSTYDKIFKSINGQKIILKIYITKNNQNFKKSIETIVKLYKEKFNIKKFYAIMIHNDFEPEDKNLKIFYKFLILLKEKKITKKIGISIYNFKKILKIINKYKFDIIQCPFSIIDQRLLENRLLNKLKKKKIEIHVRSIFLQGLLYKNKFNSYFAKKVSKILNYRKWVKLNSMSIFKSALYFVLNYPMIDKLVIGIENKNQINELKKVLKNYKYIKYPARFKSNDLKLINPHNWPK
tara:strand:- start:2119 stop:3462 length:1344 start_codon:yes stop_codon:yes gene_type:complete